LVFIAETVVPLIFGAELVAVPGAVLEGAGTGAGVVLGVLTLEPEVAGGVVTGVTAPTFALAPELEPALEAAGVVVLAEPEAATAALESLEAAGVAALSLPPPPPPQPTMATLATSRNEAIVEFEWRLNIVRLPSVLP
jgi:hypothetical protein